MKQERLREREFQAQVLELAAYYAWRSYHTFDSRRSNPGWPDLVLCRPPEILFIELKAEKTRVTKEQHCWVQALCECGLEVYIWRPGDWDEIQARLAPNWSRRKAAA